MNTEGKHLTTLGDAWKLFERHGLEGKYCPRCDQFAQARVLQRQDEIINDMYVALKSIKLWLLDDGLIDENELMNKQFIKANNLTNKALTLVIEATCPICNRRFRYPRCGYRPMTCEDKDCVKKYHPYLRRTRWAI